MNMLFLSMRASHRTVVFLTGMRGSSIRGLEPWPFKESELWE